MSALNILDCMSDPEAFGAWYAGESWKAWHCVLKGAFALPMTDSELVTFRELAGGRDPPTKRVRELWVVAGRRAGKDSIAALLAVYVAALEEGHVGRLRPGEQAVTQCLACDRDQARIVLSYVKALFAGLSDLADMVTGETRLGLTLSNEASISIATNSYRQVRGRTCGLVIFDEVAHWRSEDTVSPDREVYAAVLPSLATLPGAMLVGISTPYAKRGLLYDRWKAHFGGSSDDVLVIQAASQQLNPTLDPAVVAAAMEEDPAKAKAEWLAEWRDDLASFIDITMVENCTDRGVTVRPPRPGIRYTAFADAASGTGQDSFAVSIAHSDKQELLVDLVHEIRPPFSPSQAIAGVCGILSGYHITSVTGDKWAPGFVAECFAQHRVRYAYSERDRSQIYVEALPLLTSGRARLVENKRLALQFASLERRTSVGGRDRIDHPQNGHDDLANAAAGALVEIATKPQVMVISDAVLEYARRMPRRASAYY
jgi:hypothetical protein